MENDKKTKKKYAKAYQILKELEKERKKNLEPSGDILEILKEGDLFSILISELDKKIEGELKSKKAITLSLCSVWVEGSEVPLNTLVSSESSAGKSFICKNIIKLFPRELVEYKTKITPEYFTYWKRGEENWTWDGRICYLEDISQPILDAPTFKVMCSEGSNAGVVIKQKAVDIQVEGKPVMLVTTARTNPNSEILNRFQIISLDESKEQTKNIIFRQAKQISVIPYNKDVTDALRLLQRKKVFIPFGEKIAEFLNKSYNFESIRLRRDFSRLLDLIKCSCVLHQFQRKTNEEGLLIAQEQDYQIAREVINYIQTQTFKGLTHKLKKAFDCCKQLGEFTARDIHSKFPFANQKMWYLYLDQLLERGMLTSELKKIEEVKQRVTYYKINEGKVFELPEFKELPQNITKVTSVTKVTKVTKVTNDKKTNVTNVTNVIHNPHLKCDSCSKPAVKTLNGVPLCQEHYDQVDSMFKEEF